MTKDLDINDRSVLQALRADAEAQLACPSRSQSWADAYREFVRAVDRLDAMWARVEIGQAHIVASEGLGEPIAATPAPAPEAVLAQAHCQSCGEMATHEVGSDRVDVFAGYYCNACDPMTAEPDTPVSAQAQQHPDAERLDWLMLSVSGTELRRIGVEHSGGCNRAAIAAARSIGASGEGKSNV